MVKGKASSEFYWAACT